MELHNGNLFLQSQKVRNFQFQKVNWSNLIEKRVYLLLNKLLRDLMASKSCIIMMIVLKEGKSFELYQYYQYSYIYLCKYIFYGLYI